MGLNMKFHSLKSGFIFVNSISAGIMGYISWVGNGNGNGSNHDGLVPESIFV